MRTSREDLRISQRRRSILLYIRPHSHPLLKSLAQEKPRTVTRRAFSQLKVSTLARCRSVSGCVAIPDLASNSSRPLSACSQASSYIQLVAECWPMPRTAHRRVNPWRIDQQRRSSPAYRPSKTVNSCTSLASRQRVLHSSSTTIVCCSCRIPSSLARLT